MIVKACVNSRPVRRVAFIIKGHGLDWTWTVFRPAAWCHIYIFITLTLPRRSEWKLTNPRSLQGTQPDMNLSSAFFFVSAPVHTCSVFPLRAFFCQSCISQNVRGCQCCGSFTRQGAAETHHSSPRPTQTRSRKSF